jgi:hypothetical protein
MFADAGEKLFEIVLPDCPASLDSFIIEDKALDQQLAKLLGCPLAELRATAGADAVTNREDGVEVVVVNEPANLPRAFRLNY